MSTNPAPTIILALSEKADFTSFNFILWRIIVDKPARSKIVPGKYSGVLDAEIEVPKISFQLILTLVNHPLNGNCVNLESTNKNAKIKYDV